MDRDGDATPSACVHLVAEPTGNRSWDGLDVIPFEDGLVKRKDVYPDSVSILRQVACSSTPRLARGSSRFVSAS